MLASAAVPFPDPPMARVWTSWVRPTLVGAVALAAAVVVADLVQLAYSAVTGYPIAEGAEGSALPAGTFLLRALATDVGLLAVSFGIFRVHPGELRFRVGRREVALVAACFAGTFCANLLASWAMEASGEPYSGIPDIPRGLLGVAVVAAASTIAPAAEELFFREALMIRVFPPGSRGFALGITAVAFAALHWNAGGPLLFLGLASIGIVLGALRIKTGSIGASILVHGANNLAATLLALAARG